MSAKDSAKKNGKKRVRPAAISQQIKNQDEQANNALWALYGYSTDGHLKAVEALVRQATQAVMYLERLWGITEPLSPQSLAQIEKLKKMLCKIAHGELKFPVMYRVSSPGKLSPEGAEMIKTLNVGKNWGARNSGKGRVSGGILYEYIVHVAIPEIRIIRAGGYAERDSPFETLEEKARNLPPEGKNTRAWAEVIAKASTVDRPELFETHCFAKKIGGSSSRRLKTITRRREKAKIKLQDISSEIGETRLEMLDRQEKKLRAEPAPTRAEKFGRFIDAIEARLRQIWKINTSKNG